MSMVLMVQLKVTRSVNVAEVASSHLRVYSRVPWLPFRHYPAVY